MSRIRASQVVHVKLASRSKVPLPRTSAYLSNSETKECNGEQGASLHDRLHLICDKMARGRAPVWAPRGLYCPAAPASHPTRISLTSQSTQPTVGASQICTWWGVTSCFYNVTKFEFGGYLINNYIHQIASFIIVLTHLRTMFCSWEIIPGVGWG